VRGDGSYALEDDNPPDGDERDAFQRDRDRILYSREFSRLASVTQVVSPRTDHQLHDRLTHSLKVAQIGRRLAESPRLRAWSRDADEDPITDPDAVEAACLAHDLGHPPFGHVGESALDRLASSTKLDRVPDVGWEPCGGFEGNAQSFRIAVRLATRGTDTSLRNKRLDLTILTLNGIIKYPWVKLDEKGTDAKQIQKLRGISGKRKFCVYGDDEDFFNEIRAHHVGSKYQPSLEASIMEIADDITYAVHDLMDFYRAGFVPLPELARLGARSHAFNPLWESIQAGAKGQQEKKRRLEAARAGLAELARLKLPLETAYSNDPSAAEGRVADATGVLITRCFADVEFVEDGDGLIARFASEDVRLLVDLLQAITRRFVIESPALGLVQAGQVRVVEDLFVALVRDAESKSPRILPPEWRLGEDGERRSGGDLTRAVCDYIASLSESGAMTLHGLISGHRHDSLFSDAFGGRIV
jgi:dGTPase